MRFTKDLSRGAWTLGRFELSATAAGVVGAGFETYARILHPVQARRFDLDPTHRDQYGMRDIVESTTWTWSEVARRNGRRMHPLVQWRRLTDDESRMTFEDGWDLEQVKRGWVEPSIIAELITHLRGATTTPNDLTAGIWEGWGELHGSGVVFTPSGLRDAEAQAEHDAQYLVLVSPEIREVMKQIRHPPRGFFRRREKLPEPPLLELPDRRYLLFTTSADELSSPAWPQSAGIGWDDFGRGVMPQLIWPEDATWCIATEVDFDSTLVGGSREVITRFLGSPTLETFQVDPDDDLSLYGDRINLRREPAPHRGNPFP